MSGPRELESNSIPSTPDGDDDRTQQFGELRELLLGNEKKRLADLERRLDQMGLNADELAEHLPDAVAARTAQDKQLARSLAPTMQEAIGESVRRNPQQIAHAIFPILGPAIRKAIAETMAGFVNTLNKAIENSLSIRGLKWRIEAIRTGVPYAQIVIKHALVYRVEQVFLIHRHTSLPLAHVTAEDLESQDADLISGMLTAIRDFVQDSFGVADEGGGGLRTFSVGERTVLIEQGPRALLAAVVSGQHPQTLLARLQAVLETIHLHFGTALTEFEGDPEPFEAANPLLEECLETVLATDRPSSRSATPRIAWVAVGAVVVLASVLWVLSTLRWSRAVAALENEPGIVLVEVERGIRGGRLRGMRDPLAVDPATLLREHSIDTTRVRSHWESYLSFEASMVVRRAQRTLAAPETIDFILTGDTLYATGSATLDWAHAAQSAVATIPGVAHLDVTRAELVLPAAVQQLKGRLEEYRILFDVGSSALVGPATELIAEAAVLCEDLEEESANAGYSVSLELIGRTDATGSNETNRVLSELRANRVMVALQRRGITESLLLVRGVGTSDPISANDPQETSALNRSVSFRATVTFGIRGGGSEE